MFHQRELVRHRRARDRRRPGATCGATARSTLLRGARARGRLRRGLRPVLRPQRPDAGREPARAGAEVRDPRPDRRARADRGRVVQLPPGPLRVDLRDRARRRRRSPTPPASASGSSGSSLALFRTHGLDVDGWPAEVRAELWADEHRRRPAWSACSASIRRPTRRTRSTPASAPTPRPTATRTSSSSCCTPAATSRWRRWASRSAWTSRATSGRSSSRDPADLELLFGVDIHEMQPYRPLPVADRGAARAPGRTMIVELDSWYLPDTAATSYRSEHVKTSVDRRGDRPRRGAAALLPQRGRCTSSSGEDYRGVFRLGPAILRRRAAAVHRARPLRRRAAAARATSCARRRATAARTTWTAVRPGESVRALRRRSSPTTCRRCSTGDEAGYHAYAFATVRMVGAGVRDLRLARRLAAGRRRRARRRRRWREIVDGSQASWASSSRGGGRSTRARRSAGLGERVGRGDDRARRGRTLTPCRSRSPVARIGSMATTSGRSTTAGRRRRTDAIRPARRLGPGWPGARARAPPRASFATRTSRAATTSTARTGGSGRRSRPPRRAAARRSCSASTGSRRWPRSILNGERVARQRVDVRGPRGRRRARLLRGTNELAIRCRAARPAAARAPRKPRARWRTRLVADGNLRWFRTMLLGRAPGLRRRVRRPVGPWRPVWLERRRGLVVEALDAAARASRATTASWRRRSRPRARRATPDRVRGRGRRAVGPPRGRARAVAGRRRHPFRATLRVPAVARWWPHTHGEPALHEVRLVVGPGRRRPRSMPDASDSGPSPPGPTAAHDIERDGLDLHVNGVPRLRPRRALDADRHRRARALARRSCARRSRPCATPG